MAQYVIVDTDVVSYLFKQDSRAKQYLDRHLTGKSWAVSFMTIAQLDAWTMRYSWSDKRKERLERFLHNEFVTVPFDRFLCLKWAEVTEQGRRTGRTIESTDAWIAATALLYKVPLVTNNYKHFKSVDGLEVLSN